MAWCNTLGAPPRFDKRTVRAFLAAEADRLAPNTLVTRYNGLRQLALWLHEEQETSTFVMAGMSKPSTTYTPPPVLRDDDIRALLAACGAPASTTEETRRRCGC
jgi:integrase